MSWERASSPPFRNASMASNLSSRDEDITLSERVNDGMSGIDSKRPLLQYAFSDNF